MYNVDEGNLIKPPCYVTSHPRSNLESVPKRSGYFEKACLTCSTKHNDVFRSRNRKKVPLNNQEQQQSSELIQDEGCHCV
ncbi:hypothetical protein M758_UG189100 [Ceratodon purpureus]|nr:hypothetical protein M758_UG189100 [Ceratodon purpureus]